LLSVVRRCVEDYDMLRAGDRVAVGVSGGKDSLTALVALAALSQFYPAKFDVCAVSLGMGYKDMDFSGVAALCERLGAPFYYVETDIKTVVFDVRNEKNPCSLCANLRRGALNAAAKRLGCNKVALGHHGDDAAETFLLSLLYEGRISCFSPVTYLDRTDLTVIRPLLYCAERDIRAFSRREGLPVVSNPCPAEGNTKRDAAKSLIRQLQSGRGDVAEMILGAMQRLPLDGWKPLIPPGTNRRGGNKS